MARRNTWIGAGEWIARSARFRGIAQRAVVRSERVYRSGSPWYAYNVPQIAAGGTLANDLESQFPQSQKYGHCDEIEIINNDTVDITIQFNGAGTAGFLIPAGTINSFTDMPFRQWLITNNSGSTATTLGDIRISMRRMPETADTQSRGKRFNVR